MKTFFKWALVLPLVASMTMIGCSKDDDETPAPVVTSPVDGKELIFTATSTEAEADIEVYADEALFVGYNRLYIMVYETGTKTVIDNAHVSFKTEMQMGMGMTHSSPVEDPTDDTPDDGVFKGAVVFVMPTTATGTWDLEVKVHNHSNNLEGTVKSQVDIISPAPARMYSFVSQTDGL